MNDRVICPICLTDIYYDNTNEDGTVQCPCCMNDIKVK
jgi:hypothetical protein